MNEPYRLRYANQAVGFFLLLILILMVALAFLVLRAGNYFVEQDSYYLNIKQNEIGDLHKGADVMILGERAGSIESIRYVDSTNLVRVNLSVRPEMSRQIFTDSIVSQERRFGLGNPVLVIRRSDDPDDDRMPLPPGSELENYVGEADAIDLMTREVELVSQSIQMIEQQLRPTLESIAGATDKLQDTLKATADPALVQSRQAAESFYQTSETVRPQTLETMRTVQDAAANLENKVAGLTDQVSDLVEGDITEALDQVQVSSRSVRDASNAVAQTAESVNEDMAVTLDTLRGAAEQVQKLAVQTQELVAVLQDEAQDLPGTTRRVNDTVSDTQDLVEEIRSHWLLRRYSNQGKPSVQISPSNVRAGGSLR
ncbi:MlaD family protein [Crateriforma conspicua]|uniref:Mce/MlaD domain-containing protein n=1 Tax=Crateriforma conspicua TaxID=2527996 RepID=A0A5C6FVB5_9PLAN|nr:MlaD family protein [Crateriforma conspicua]TWU65545.1 hypothetical protein V7x_10930 [Crateriforma conspicua]